MQLFSSVLAMLMLSGTALADTYTSFVLPADPGPEHSYVANPVWQIGTIQVVQWTTQLDQYNLSLYQQDLSKSSAEVISNIYTSIGKGSGAQNFSWVVQSFKADLFVSNVFYLDLRGSHEATSHYFNITSASVSSSSSATPAALTTIVAFTASAAATTTTTNTLEPMVSTSSSTKATASTFTHLGLALGLGLGLGLPLILFITIGSAFFLSRRRRPGPYRGAYTQQPSADHQHHSYDQSQHVGAKDAFPLDSSPAEASTTHYSHVQELDSGSTRPVELQ